MLSLATVCIFATVRLPGVIPVTGSDITETTANMTSSFSEEYFQVVRSMGNTYTKLEWPFFCRICSAVLSSSAVLLALIYEVRATNVKLDRYEEDKSTKIVITSSTIQGIEIEEYHDLL